MKTLAISLIIAATLSTVNALKCYTCHNTESWDKCKESQEEYSCTLKGSIKCMKTKIETKITSNNKVSTQYLKGCAVDAFCNAKTNSLCSALPGQSVSCNINCCSGDLCNTGAVPLVSSILILACAVLSILKAF